MLLDEGRLREDSSNVDVAFDVVVSPFDRAPRLDLEPVLARKRGKGDEVGIGVGEHRGEFIELGQDVLLIGLGEYCADDRGHHLLRSLHHHREDVSHGVEAVALPAGALAQGASGFLHPSAGVGHDQLHPFKSSGLQRPQKIGPEALVLTGSEVETEPGFFSVGRTEGHGGVALGGAAPEGPGRTTPAVTSGSSTPGLPRQ